MAGDADLAQMITALRRLEKLPEEAAKKAAPLIEAVAKKQAAEGKSPTGEEWAPLKKGGGRALKNAAAAVSARSNGTTVTIVLKGPEVIHNFGTSRIPRRQILPDAGAGVPKVYAAAVIEAATNVFNRTVRNG